MSAFSFQFYDINNETLFSLKYVLNVLLPRLRIKLFIQNQHDIG